MPRHKKPDWERVTITMSGEAADALRVLGALTRREMGQVADDYLRRGGLLDGVSLIPRHPRSQESQSPAPVTAPGAPAEPRPPAPPRVPGAPYVRRGVPQGEERERLERLLQWVETLLADGQLAQGEVATAAGITTANYRSWRDTGRVPPKYAASVLRLLASKGLSLQAPKPQEATAQ